MQDILEEDQQPSYELSIEESEPLLYRTSTQPTCRICYDDDPKKTLISPCQCSGTMQYVHRECLLEWLKSSPRSHRCEICHEEYNSSLIPFYKQAKKAGMKYAVITAKHHEGFNLFDSKFTDYKSTNTPYGKDILREWVEAFRSEGLKIGFYYSLFDWHHPHYTADPKHPLRAPSHGKEPGSVIQKNKETGVFEQKSR